MATAVISGVDRGAVVATQTVEEEGGVKKRTSSVALEAMSTQEKRRKVSPEPLTKERVSQIKERAEIDPFLARAIAQGGITPLKGDSRIVKEHLETKHNVDIGEGTDQKSSGRCWIFSGLNLMRSYRLKEYGKEFEYSQNYVAFWDKLERANHFLETMIGAHEESVGSQKLQFVLDKMYTDGGEWELFANIVEKYGVVPKSAMPETQFSGRSSGYMSMIKTRLREVGGVLHKRAIEISSMEEGEEKERAIQSLRDMKETGLSEVYRILVSYLGTPPETFYWKKPGSEKFESLTPQEFFAESKSEIGKKVHLTHLPYLEGNKKVIAEDIGNVEEGKRLQSLNVSMEEIKIAVRESIKAGEPVEIACEMKHLDGKKKLLSIENDKIDEIFRFDPRLRLEKGEALNYQVTTIAHGMVLVGCDDPETTKVEGDSKECPASLGPLWKVENSWKDKQVLYMTDAWFEEYCYGVVVDEKYLPPKVKALHEGESEPIQLPAWDPFCKI